MAAERDALRAVIEGRAVAPTDAELDAHAGLLWLVLFSDGGMDVVHDRFARIHIERIKGAVPLPHPVRWWALGRDGRPCGWPEVSRG